MALVNKPYTACKIFKDGGKFLAEQEYNTWLRNNRGARILKVVWHFDSDSGGCTYHSIFIMYRHKEKRAIQGPKPSQELKLKKAKLKFG